MTGPATPTPATPAPATSAAAPPAIPPADPLVTRLRADAAAASGGGMLLLGAGVAAGLLTVGVLVVLLWGTVGLPGIGFWGWFVVIALLFSGGAAAWLNRRGGLLAGGAFEYTDPRQEWAGVGRYDGAAAPLGMAADGLFVGPRMVTAGLGQASDREPASRERFFDRCALLLRQLAKAGEAVRIETVRIGADETEAKLRPVTGYLDRAGWIGQSSDGVRLWLSSRAKTDLIRLGVPVGPAEPS